MFSYMRSLDVPKSKRWGPSLVFFFNLLPHTSSSFRKMVFNRGLPLKCVVRLLRLLRLSRKFAPTPNCCSLHAMDHDLLHPTYVFLPLNVLDMMLPT
ncbi:hypothetical protein VIGAN_08267100 [Vigna angularis var. angularis]|uniref:Uncharacterized protein n=1 Tax=Vigna angularis var. angularis TaxID=157739 RepID=A0A0S3SSQ7_PHAAN|nr:hypothetical protein VIGAN_08267100 [Vigna angularis var. angularis]